MKFNMLTKSLTAITLATVASSSMAAGAVVESAGDTLTNVTDTVYSALTGKSVSTLNINHPVSLTDYTQATSEYEDAYVTGHFNAADTSTSSSSYDADLTIDYDKVLSSPNANTQYKAQFTGAVANTGNDSNERVETYAGEASAKYDQYFNPGSDAFWFGKGQVNINNTAGISNPRTELSGGVGYGRVVNVTPMAQAMRLVEALAENGSITKLPNAQAYNRVAQIIANKEAYETKFTSRYAQYWVGDIAKALGTQLDANAVIRTYEVLENEKVSTRKSGWDARAGIGMVVTDYDGSKSKPAVNLEGNYYQPISARTQFGNSAKLSFVLNDDNNNYLLTNDMGLTYEVSDRVDWENKWKLEYNDNSNANILKNALETAFVYNISNSLDYTTSVNFNHTKVENQDSYYDRGIKMGVKYRLK